MPIAKYNKLLGGTSGIGYATAECALEAGDSIIIANSNPKHLRQLYRV